MNLIELSKCLNDEGLAEDYLYDKGILKRFNKCPFCGSERIGNIRRNRIKCYKCKKEWHKRKDSFLESRHISNSRFIGFLKLYCGEVNPIIISKELDSERKTIIELQTKIRYIISLNNEIPTSKELIIFVQNGNIKIDNFKSDLNRNLTYALLELKCYKELSSIYSFLIKAKMKFGKNFTESSFKFYKNEIT